MPLRLSVKKEVKKEIQASAEKKEFYVANTLQNVTTTGGVVSINTIAEGDEYTNRQGRIVKSRYIDVQYSLYQSSIDSSADGSLVALVWDKTPNGSVAAVTDILLTGSAGNPSLAFKNTPNNAERFHIAWVDYLPNCEEGSIQVGSNAVMTKKRNFYRIPEKYSNSRYGNTTAVTPNLGGWYLLYIDASNTTTTSRIDYTIKYVFTDI